MDLDAILTPIAADRPAGADLRLEAGSNALAEAIEHRRAEDPGLVGDDAKTADWRAVVRTCTRGLESESKDLELASYLLEGLAHTEGIPGVTAGLGVILGLVRSFWPQLHPGADDGGIDLELRSSWLSRIGSGKDTLRAVRSIPLTVALGQTPALTLRDYEESRRVEDAQRTRPAVYQEMMAQGAIDAARWQQSFVATPDDRRAANHAAAEAALEALKQLQGACKEHFAADDLEPSWGGLQELLEEIRTLQTVRGSDDGGMAVDVGGAPGSAAPGGGGGGSGALRSRNDAIQRLREVAAFLRSTEPHSPVSHLVERCVRWLGMPFEQLIVDFIKTREVISAMRETLGLPNDETPAG